MLINFVDDNGESFLCLRHPHSFHKLLALTVFLWGLGQTAQAALGVGSDSPWRDYAWGCWLRTTRGGAGGSVVCETNVDVGDKEIILRCRPQMSII